MFVRVNYTTYEEFCEAVQMHGFTSFSERPLKQYEAAYISCRQPLWKLKQFTDPLTGNVFVEEIYEYWHAVVKMDEYENCYVYDGVWREIKTNYNEVRRIKLLPPHSEE